MQYILSFPCKNHRQHKIANKYCLGGGFGKQKVTKHANMLIKLHHLSILLQYPPGNSSISHLGTKENQQLNKCRLLGDISCYSRSQDGQLNLHVKTFMRNCCWIAYHLFQVYIAHKIHQTGMLACHLPTWMVEFVLGSIFRFKNKQSHGFNPRIHHILG